MKVTCDITTRNFKTIELELPDNFEELSSTIRKNILHDAIKLNNDEELCYVENVANGAIYLDD